jgi:hypothetical protein
MLLHLNLKDQMYFNLKIPTYCNISYVTLLLIALANTMKEETHHIY